MDKAFFTSLRSGWRAIPGAMVFIAIGLAAATTNAAIFDTIGVTLLSETTTNLNGAGVRVAQVEADGGGPYWEVDPASVGVPAGNFTYYSSNSVSGATGFPNAVGMDSPHGDGVGQDFYGISNSVTSYGVATNVAHIDIYEADYFVDVLVPDKTALNAVVVNQSFDASGASTSELETIDTDYDNYSAQYGTLFVTGAGDGGTVDAPGTCYNGIGVGAYQGSSSVGPTPDNGRAKPDITSPYVQSDVTSFSTPLVSGLAALLQQAGGRGDGGSDTTAATDARMLKALLLNGAIKPADWTNDPPSPLDPRYGAGVVNVFESYNQLIGGKQAFIATSSVATGSAHPPTGATGNISSLHGWDFNTITSSVSDDAINHYYFDLPGGNAHTATVTLAWNRQASSIVSTVNLNELNLFLYNTASGSLITGSTSTVDNVQHLYMTNLPPGRYDAQVWKSGGLGSKNVSNAETYALAFEFFTESLTVAPANGGGVALTWPLYPAGFVLQSTPSLTAPITWSDVNVTPMVANNQNVVAISPAAGYQFFRLSR